MTGTRSLARATKAGIVNNDGSDLSGERTGSTDRGTVCTPVVSADGASMIGASGSIASAANDTASAIAASVPVPASADGGFGSFGRAPTIGSCASAGDAGLPVSLSPDFGTSIVAGFCSSAMGVSAEPAGFAASLKKLPLAVSDPSRPSVARLMPPRISPLLGAWRRDLIRSSGLAALAGASSSP